MSKQLIIISNNARTINQDSYLYVGRLITTDEAPDRSPLVLRLRVPETDQPLLANIPAVDNIVPSREFIRSRRMAYFEGKVSLEEKQAAIQEEIKQYDRNSVEDIRNVLINQREYLPNIQGSFQNRDESSNVINPVGLEELQFTDLDQNMAVLARGMRRPPIINQELDDEEPSILARVDRVIYNIRDQLAGNQELQITLRTNAEKLLNNLIEQKKLCRIIFDKDSKQITSMMFFMVLKFLTQTYLLFY